MKTSPTQNLINKLTTDTQDLKNEYVVKTKEWAVIDFETISKITHQDVINDRGYDRRKYESIVSMERFGRKVDPENPSTYMAESKASYAYWNKVCNIRRNGEAAYVAAAEANAILHFEQSVQKLVYRIIQKGLNPENVVLTSSKIGVNFETRATDGIKTVVAFTIIASGPVQRPHYRYLLK